METTLTKSETVVTDNEPNPPPDNSHSVYFWLIICSMMMFTLPFATFFMVRDLLRDYFHIVGFENTGWSVFAAVLVVNLIICFYAYIAYIEDTEEQPPKEKKKN